MVRINLGDRLNGREMARIELGGMATGKNFSPRCYRILSKEVARAMVLEVARVPPYTMLVSVGALWWLMLLLEVERDLQPFFLSDVASVGRHLNDRETARIALGGMVTGKNFSPRCYRILSKEVAREVARVPPYTMLISVGAWWWLMLLLEVERDLQPFFLSVFD
jgi:hypothetical protein